MLLLCHSLPFYRDDANGFLGSGAMGRYTLGMNIDYNKQEASSRLDDYYENDPDLYDLFDEVLTLLERDNPDDEGHRRLRKTYLRPPGVFVVEVFPRPPRAKHYYLMWEPEKEQTSAYIRYIGPGVAAL